MLPTDFIVLPALPLTPYGKIDRQALPAPGRLRPHLDTPYVAPRTLLEERLTEIWESVLSVESPGVYDNFFDVGGHSLLATQIIARVSTAFGIELTPQTFLSAPSIAAMAEVMLDTMLAHVEPLSIGTL